MSANESAFLSAMAIGDAFGMKYEFIDHDIPAKKDELFFGHNPKFLEYQTAHYTDDTQMALANAELLLRKNTKDIISRNFVEAWLEVFQRDPRLGYSKRMYALMSENPTPMIFLARVDAKRGFSNGAAMRAAPFGLIADAYSVKKFAARQAVLTHNTDTGIISAQAVALATHFLHHGGKPEFMDAFLGRQLGKDWASAKNGLVEDPNNGLNTVLQALNAMKGKNSMSEILLSGISQAREADTDTVCAIATAIASRRADFQFDVPEKMQNEIENDRYGIEYLRKIDSELLKKFPRSRQYENFSL